MASLSFVRYLINCDGCLAAFGDREGFESLIEARVAAYASGWRFPNRLTATGDQARATSDVCPKCVAIWQPVQATKLTNRQRALTKAEVALLLAPRET